MKRLLPLLLILVLLGCDKNKISLPQAHVYDAIFIGDSLTQLAVIESPMKMAS